MVTSTVVGSIAGVAATLEERHIGVTGGPSHAGRTVQQSLLAKLRIGGDPIDRVQRVVDFSLVGRKCIGVVDT